MLIYKIIIKDISNEILISNYSGRKTVGFHPVLVFIVSISVDSTPL